MLIRRFNTTTNAYNILYEEVKVLIEDATSPTPDQSGYIASDYQYVAFITPSLPNIADPDDSTLLTNIRVTDELVLLDTNYIYYVIRIPPESGLQDVQVLYLSDDSRIRG